MTIAFTARIGGSATSSIENAILNSLAPRFTAAADAAGQIGTTRMAQTAPRPKHPGHASGKRSRSLSDLSSYAYAVTPAAPGSVDLRFTVNGDDAFMAKFFATNFGSRPHRINATRAQRLVFPGTNQYAGQTIRVPSVNHPGTRAANPYYQRAIEFALRSMLALL